MTTAVLTFALDGETPVLAAGRRYAEHAMVMSHQAFESQVGLPRLLELLASYSAPATFSCLVSRPNAHPRWSTRSWRRDTR
jgi:hypothetical protein